MGIYTSYEPARGPSGGPAPGAKAMMAWYLWRYEGRSNPRPANLGIYNPKRLGSGWSLHAEGRAGDLGTAPYAKPPWGWGLADDLRLNSLELGIQLIIFDGKIWSGNFPHEGWRQYSGSEPHRGHLHVELSRKSAASLTEDRIEAVLGDGGSLAPRPSIPSNPAPEAWQERIIGNMKLIDLSNAHNVAVRGGPMKELQGLLLAEGYGPKGLVGRNGLPDGVGGPATRGFLGHFQSKHKTGYSSNPSKPDYKAGEKTWTKLLGQ